MLFPQTTLNCAGSLLDLSAPVVMGILNITPDSFFDGGQYQGEKAVLTQCEKMLSAGAALIDIGAASSRPGAAVVAVADELHRLLPLLKKIRKTFPDAILSIDTFRAEVAEASVGEGGQIINDVSAGSFDAGLWPMVAKLQVPYVLMHMQGNPQTMQGNPQYENVTMEVLDFFIRNIEKLRILEVHDIILDPGFGFGKTVAHNFQLLREMAGFKILDLPLLAGLSRKSMICKVLKVNPENALNGSTALHMAALQNGAKILRVHDVQEAVETIRLWEQLERLNG